VGKKTAKKKIFLNSGEKKRPPAEAAKKEDAKNSYGRRDGVTEGSFKANKTETKKRGFQKKKTNETKVGGTKHRGEKARGDNAEGN